MTAGDKCPAGEYLAHLLPLTSGARGRTGSSFGAAAIFLIQKASPATPAIPEVIAKATRRHGHFRSEPLEQRKATFAELLYNVRDGIAFNRRFSGDGAMIFKHACALGCEGIVSKRLGSTYRAGRVNHWRKIKNPAAPAVKREAEEDWVSSEIFR
jgi:hypothetical protein